MADIDKILFFIFLFLIGVAVPAHSQINSREIPQQSVYLELGGNGLIYSLNYDFVFQSNWGVRLGGGYYPFYIDDEDQLNFGNANDPSAF